MLTQYSARPRRCKTANFLQHPRLVAPSQPCPWRADSISLLDFVSTRMSPNIGPMVPPTHVVLSRRPRWRQSRASQAPRPAQTPPQVALSLGATLDWSPRCALDPRCSLSDRRPRQPRQPHQFRWSAFRAAIAWSCQIFAACATSPNFAPLKFACPTANQVHCPWHGPRHR